MIGSGIAQESADAIEKMGGTATDGLGVVFAFVDHLIIVDGGDLGVPLPGDFSVHVGKLLD